MRYIMRLVYTTATNFKPELSASQIRLLGQQNPLNFETAQHITAKVQRFNDSNTKRFCNISNIQGW